MNTKDFMARLSGLRIAREKGVLTGQQYNRELLLIHEQHAAGLMVVNPALADALTSRHVALARHKPAFVRAGLDMDGWYVVLEARGCSAEYTVRTLSELSEWQS
ncbi:hypothetical protein PssvBMR6_gp05 [Pseudomonas phage MR6]|uniref:Uncharacterized protein n=1 Tax=Pseudomonas phage MR5 TaxID=2711172 RepID=A0A6M3TCN8_9CAUD|nr:hypothetical protein PssvBMR5_gp05 [Pseudomonas phage MR5]QJD54833.1 hypothetical protein PssvBMR6_gp05 [Pseudomonas phage MR6]QJD54892.1 hypothetical protein PssvBMR7_gp05 [Pseudomonas phage MR7]QJD54953.1 hypothetical protein PssvBMR8_gp05 [Pseudomonas phage MR8]QJD55010.1 hypothetical protein PssvBMR12_gp05 [Pseudomonas phage MR12]QJD55313.1 hypothetical protein PssvBMR18_gp05 [Pseudomonas phage MR18]